MPLYTYSNNTQIDTYYAAQKDCAPQILIREAILSEILEYFTRVKSSRKKPLDLRQSLTTRPFAYKRVCYGARAYQEGFNTYTCGLYPNLYDIKQRWTRQHVYMPSYMEGGPFDASDEVRINSKVLHQVEGARTDISKSIPNVGKMVKTCTEIVETCIMIARCIHRMNCRLPGIRINGNTVVKRWANCQLYYNYGLSTTASTLQSLAEAYNGDALALGIPLKVTDKSVYNGITGGWVWQHTIKTKIGGYVFLNKDNENPIDVGNPIEWLWEGIPFSFVVDWIIPVGNAIASIDTLKSINKTVAYRTTRRTVRAKYEIPSPGYKIKNHGFYYYNSHQRDMYSGPVFMLPTFKFAKSTNTLLNAIALLVQLRVR